MKKIYGELSRIQKELNAPKNLFNKFGNYYYRNAEGILAAVKPLLNGMALIINDKPVMIGNRFYIEATATLTDGEESVSATAYAREDEVKKGMDGCQLTGACSSYARKYALNALLMIDDSKDSDDESLSPKNPANQKDENPNPPIEEGKEINGVAIAKKLPSIANLMRNEICDIQERLNLPTYEDARKQVFAWGDALMASGAVEKFDWKTITEEQAKMLFKAIRNTFKPGEAA